MRHPATEDDLRWNRETLELPAPDEQQLIIYLPADQQTTHALGQLQGENQPRSLHAI
jgi:hypothetical protein